MEAKTEHPTKWPLFLIGGLLFLGVLSIVAWNVELGYLAVSVGPVSDASDSVVTEEVAVFPSTGELLVLTVITQDINVFEMLIAGVDPTIDVIRKQSVRRPGETDEQYRNRVLQQMDDSNFRSVATALRYLEIEMVPIEVVINEIIEGVPAEDVLELGDSIRVVNGINIRTVEDLRASLDGLAPGDSVTMTVDREGSMLDLEIRLAEHPDRPGDPMIGIIIGELTRSPFPLDIQAGDLGGPSAGMIHTLAIIDILTEGELTAGRVIAGTGTIALDGTVGNIGGIRQKVVGAEAAGAEFILVPEGNYQSALTAEFETIEIVPVATLEDAIEFLETLAAA